MHEARYRIYAGRHDLRTVEQHQVGLISNFLCALTLLSVTLPLTALADPT